MTTTLLKQIAQPKHSLVTACANGTAMISGTVGSSLSREWFYNMDPGTKGKAWGG